MARTVHKTETWAIAEYTGGGAWRPETPLPRPGKITFSTPIVSTHTKKILVDGGIGRLRSEITWNPEEIRFAWPTQRNTILQDRLTNYVKSGSPLRLTTHIGDEFYGRFTRFTSEWKLSGDEQYYGIEITLDTYKQENLENE